MSNDWTRHFRIHHVPKKVCWTHALKNSALTLNENKPWLMPFLSVLTGYSGAVILKTPWLKKNINKLYAKCTSTTQVFIKKLSLLFKKIISVRMSFLSIKYVFNQSKALETLENKLITLYLFILLSLCFIKEPKTFPGSTVDTFSGSLLVVYPWSTVYRNPAILTALFLTCQFFATLLFISVFFAVTSSFNPPASSSSL